VQRIVKGGLFMFIIGRNSDLDFTIAREVFNVEPDKFRWGVPFFSVDRNAAAMVNTEMAFRKNKTRELYELELMRIAHKRGWEINADFCGLAILIMLLLPEEICNAAIIACRGCECEAAPTDIDMGHTLCLKTARGDSSGCESKTA
jgi:hypothetical protein